MEEDQVVPQLTQNNKEKKKNHNINKNNLVVPNHNDNFIQDEEEVELYQNEINNDDDEFDDIDISLVLEFLILNRQVHAIFKYGDINQLTELYPFEEQPIRQNPRNRNLSFEDVQTISTQIDIPTILEKMDLLETNTYYVIFEQRI
tara:strand:- start:191 stop:628 length:438 start_codon:yes stop_codon:yes gene_type:complete